MDVYVVSLDGEIVYKRAYGYRSVTTMLYFIENK